MSIADDAIFLATLRRAIEPAWPGHVPGPSEYNADTDEVYIVCVECGERITVEL